MANTKAQIAAGTLKEPQKEYKRAAPGPKPPNKKGGALHTPVRAVYDAPHGAAGDNLKGMKFRAA